MKMTYATFFCGISLCIFMKHQAGWDSAVIVIAAFSVFGLERFLEGKKIQDKDFEEIRTELQDLREQIKDSKSKVSQMNMKLGFK